jgi:signal transduction histidine kinase
MNYIRDGAERMDRLIKDLLEYSRAGQEDIPAEIVNLSDVVTIAAENLEMALKHSHGEINVTENLPQVFGRNTKAR